MVEQVLHGRYRLLQRHAVGGMASLWRARDERSGEIVALKRVHPYLLADPTTGARLRREAEILRTVDHPAIVQPRELIGEPDDPVLVMEFAHGRSLKERIAEDGPIPADEALGIAQVVADALDAAHRAGIVHRDIKPSNILVEDSGVVHLVDFGIATDTEAPGMTLTTSQSIVGTPRYTAPERLAGARATPQSDVWALGAVLYEMLTGRPVAGDTDRRRAADTGSSQALALDGIPPAVATIVGRALSADPTDRYPDAGALRDALEFIDEGTDPDAATAVTPLPVVALPQARPPANRLSPVDRVAAVFFGAVAVVALAATVAFGVGGLLPASSAPAGTGIDADPAITTVGEPGAATPAVDDQGEEKGRAKGDDEKSNRKGNGKGNGKGND